jgi:uncharacterized membrane protein
MDLISDLPLHPALVHLPLGLAVLTPLLAVALLVFRRALGPAAAWLLALSQGLALAGGIAAAQAGERDEDRAEAAGVPEAAIEAHEEGAEAFQALLGAAFAAGAVAAGLGARAAAGPALGLAALLSAAALGQGIRVGHSGGELVWGPGGFAGAPAAGADGGPTGGGAQPDAGGDEDEEDEEDDD